MSFRQRLRLLVALALLPVLAVTACRREADGGRESGGGSARFAAPSNWVAQADAGEVRPAEMEPFRLTNAFSVLQTELSPAVVVHSETSHLTVFAGLTNVGLSAPKFVAWATRNGPRSFQRGETLDVSVMAENWVLVWWAGAEGWTNWDCPWVVYLQHKPDKMSLDADGLHLDFPKRAGDVVMMPLYGYEKLPLEGRDFRAEHQLPKLKVPVKTWEWAKVIPRDPLTRVRYWGAATRDFPVRVEEAYRIDGARGELTIRSRFQWMPISDDWRSRRIKLTPVSPALALAAKVGGFQVRFSERWFDLEMPTPFGPCFGVQDVDSYEVTLPVLSYVTESVELAVLAERVRAYLESHGKDGAQAVVTKFEESLRRGTVDWPALSAALPMALALGRTNEFGTLRGLVGKLAAGNAAAGNLAVSPEAFWAYVNFTGDASVVKPLWPQVRSQFDPPAGTGWASPKRVENGDRTGGAIRGLAFARLAFLAGDREAYRRGCVAFAGELVGLFLRERGSEYFYQHQPWHSMEAFQKRGVLLSLAARNTGWDVDAGAGGIRARDDRATQRGTEHPDADIARFLRDVGATARTSETSDAMLSGASTNGFGPSAEIRLRLQKLFHSGAVENFLFDENVSGTNGEVTMLVSTTAGNAGAVPAWPQLTWPRWRTPTGTAWTFGEVRPVRQGAPLSMQRVPVEGGNSWRLDGHPGAK